VRPPGDKTPPKSAKERKAAFDRKMSNRGRVDPTSPERWPCTIYLTAEAKQRLVQLRDDRQMLGCATETNSELVELLIRNEALDVRPADIRMPPSVSEAIRDLSQHLKDVRKALTHIDATLNAHLDDWIHRAGSTDLMDRIIRAARYSPTEVAARYEIESEVKDLMNNFISTFSEREVPEPLKQKSAQWIDKLLRARNIPQAKPSDPTS